MATPKGTSTLGSSILSMGSVRNGNGDEDTTQMGTPKGPSNLGSIWICQHGEGSKSLEIIEPKNEAMQTPTHQFTRSIIVLSDSKSRLDGSPVIRDTGNGTQSSKNCKRQMDSVAADSSSKKKRVVHHEIPQVSVYFIPAGSRFGGSVNVFFKNNVISRINNKLTASQKELFRRTCFGHFLQVGEIRLQHQLIHKILLMEVRQSTHDEMWFKVCGKHFKFSVEEFALVSGLKCDGNDDMSMHELGECRIKEKYFGHKKKILRKDIEQIFRNLPEYTPDEDVVKLGILYLLTTFLFTTPKPNTVSKATMRLVDSPHMNSFPWGKELFQITYMYLKLALAKPNPNVGNTKGTLSYRLQGFPIAFQVWIYECITSLPREVCVRVGHNSPRIINWSSSKTRVTSAIMDKILSEDKEVKVVVPHVLDEEKNAVYYKGLPHRERLKIPSATPFGEDLLDDPIQQAKDQNFACLSNPTFMPCPKSITPDAIKMREPHIIRVLEDLMNQMLELQANQTRMMDIQTDLKSDVIRLENKYNILLEETRAQNKFTHITDIPYRSSNPSKGPDTTNTKSVDGVEKAIPKMNCSPDEERNAAISESPAVLNEKSSVPGLTDDIKFTEEDLIHVDEIVNSANMLKRRSASKHGDHVVNPITPQLESYSKDLNQSCGEEITPPGNFSNCNYKCYAFKDGMEVPNVDDVDVFEEWFRDGYRPAQIKFKFPPTKDILNPPLQFGPYVVDTKTWWYELCQQNVFLKDSHMNICFYYIRKMLKYSDKISFKATTTDSFFGSMVRSAFNTCKDDIHAISQCKSLIQYVNGEYLHCSIRWADVEHVLIPIMMDKKAHWILGHFNIKERSLYVYNSSRLTARDRMVIVDLEAFAYVLPCLMVNINIWQPKVVGRLESVDPISVKIQDGIPQDEYGHNCGMYVIKFAEYIIHRKIDVMADTFDPKTARLYLAAQLYKHVCEKVIEDYETDFDLVSRSIMRDRKMKGIVIA